MKGNLLLLKGGLVAASDGIRTRDILVRDGKVAAIGARIDAPEGTVVVEAGGLLVTQSFADIHVHFREPGFTAKETIATGSAAAARGGYGVVCAMPNLNPVPDSPETLAVEQAAIDRDAVIDVLPYCAITKGRKGLELVDIPALKDRCVAFSDDGSGVQDEAMMRLAMETAAREDVIIAAHCEDNALLKGGYIHDGRYAAAHGHRGICSESEWGQIARDLALAEETGCRYHVCHISTRESVELIRAAKARGVRVTCETGPHYLTLCEDDMLEDGRFKMNPPLRSADDREALLEGLADGPPYGRGEEPGPERQRHGHRGTGNGLPGPIHETGPDRPHRPGAPAGSDERRAPAHLPPRRRPCRRRPGGPRRHRPRASLHHRPAVFRVHGQVHPVRGLERPGPGAAEPEKRKTCL